jgi:hypothetical protein
VVQLMEDALFLFFGCLDCLVSALQLPRSCEMCHFPHSCEMCHFPHSCEMCHSSAFYRGNCEPVLPDVRSFLSLLTIVVHVTSAQFSQLPS